MSRNLIILLVAVVLLVGIATTIALKIHRRTMISEGENLFRNGEYQRVVDELETQVSGNAWAMKERMLVARSLYRLRQYDRAQEVIDPLLQFGKEETEALALSGWIWLKKDSFLRAQERFEKIYDRDKEAEAEAGLGAVALLRSEGYKRADLDEARRRLEKAMELDSSIPQVYVLLADVLCIQHEYDEAVKVAFQGVKISPYWSDIHVMLGRCYLLAGNGKRARESFEEALQKGAAEAETKFYLARSIYFQGRIKEALSLWDELIRNGGDIAREARIDAAKVSLVLGQTDRAVSYLQALLKEKLNLIQGIQLYEIHVRLGRPLEAEHLLQELVTGWPFSSGVQLETGNRMLASGELSRAYSAFQNALDNDPANYWANYNLGCISIAQGYTYQAPEFFQLSSREFGRFFPCRINLVLSLLAVGREVETRPLLQDLVLKFPENPMVFQAQALERFLAGFPVVSLQRIQNSLESEPDQAIPFIIRGEIFLRLFQFEEAYKNFQTALDIDPLNIRAKVGLAHAFFRMGETQKAGEIYEELLTRENDLTTALYIEIHNGDALIDAMDGDYATALNTWETIQTLNDVSRQLATVNTAVYGGFESSSSEMDDLTKATLLQNPIPEGFYNLALLQEQSGQTDAAITTYEQGIDKYPSFIPALYNLADLYRQNGRYIDSISLFEQTIKTAPNRVDVLNNLAAAHEKNQEYDRVEELLQNAVEIDRYNPTLYFNQAITALNEENLAEAEAKLVDLRTLGTSSGSDRILEGLIFAKRGEWNKAEKAFADARAKMPRDPYAALNHGVALTELHQYSDAEQALQDALTCDPSLAASYRVLGLLYCRLGLYDEAEESLQASLNLDSEQIELQTIVKQIRGWKNLISLYP